MLGRGRRNESRHLCAPGHASRRQPTPFPCSSHQCRRLGCAGRSPSGNRGARHRADLPQPRGHGDTGTRGHGDMGSEHQEWPVPLVPWRDVFALASQGGMVDLVKVDIEGAEEQVIPCITPDEAARMRFLVVETHGPSARQVVTGHLQALNFTRLSEEPGTGTTHLAFWKAPG